MNTDEKIETIVLSFLHTRTQSGAMGTIIERSPNSFIVYADGKRVTVRSTAIGWHVRNGLVEAINSNLLDAAHDCLAA